MIGIGRRYSYKRQIASPVAGCILMQLVSAAAKSLIITEVNVTQVGNTTSAQVEVLLARYSAAATGLTAAVSADISPLDAGDANESVQLGTALTGYSATVTNGTQQDELVRRGFNILNGFQYLPVPENRIVMGGGGIFTVRCGAAAWPVGTYNVEIIFAEIG